MSPLPEVSHNPYRIWGILGAVWGVGGVLALLSNAAVRLGAVAVDGLQMELTGLQWLVLIANAAFMLHAEGYKGFQKGFSPRVVARARYLARAPTPLTVVLAPLFCMSFFGATRVRLITTYALTAGIISLVVLFAFIPQPWRGVLDLGVAAGIGWGVASTIAFAVRALSGRDTDVSPELPQPVV